MSTDEITERIRAMRYQEDVPYTRSLSEIFLNKPQPRFDFPDDHLLGNKAIRLNRLSDAEACQMGRQVIPMLASSGMSERGAATLMLLAYQLRDPGDTNRFVLEGVDGLASLEAPDVTVGELPEDQGVVVNLRPLRPIGDDKAEAMAYAYIAASTFRLFTKSEENYKRAFNQILHGYSKFYRERIPIAAPAPSMEALRWLSIYFRNTQSVFKATLFRLLYLGGGGGTATAVNLREFLYESHLVNTGMHIVGIFFKLKTVLKCTPELLLRAMYLHMYERQIRALCSMLCLEKNEDGKHSRGMWRYGRVFDESFMSPLQTKECRNLAYSLATALKSVAPESNKDILNIVQFADINEENKLFYEQAGRKMVERIREENARRGQVQHASTSSA